MANSTGRNTRTGCIQRVEVVGGMLDNPDFEPQCFTDDSGTTFFGIFVLVDDVLTIQYFTVNPDGSTTPYNPTSAPVPCAPNDVESNGKCWLATVDTADYSIGDELTQWFFYDVTASPPDLIGVSWYNDTTAAVIPAAVPASDRETCEAGTIGWAVDLCDVIDQAAPVIVDSYPGVDGQVGNWQIMNGGFTVDYDVTAPSESADILAGSDGGIALRNTGVPNDGPVVVTVPAAGIDTWSIDIFDLDLATLERVMFDVAPIAFTNALQIDPFTFEGVGDGLLSQFTFPGAVTVVTVTRPDLNAGEYVLEQVTINPPVVEPATVPFQRCYEKDANGTVTVQDLDYDGNPYVVQGSESQCCNDTELPSCYEWVDNEGFVHVVTAFARLDSNASFETWVILQGDEPPDLFDPTALAPCIGVTRIGNMCCRGELPDNLLVNLTNGGDLAFRFKARESALWQNVAATIPADNAGETVAKIDDISGENQIMQQAAAGDEMTLIISPEGFRRLESNVDRHLDGTLTNVTAIGEPFSIAYVFEPEPGTLENSAFISSTNGVDPALPGSWQIGRGQLASAADLVFRNILVDIPIPYPGGWAGFEASGKHIVLVFYDGVNIQISIDGTEYLNVALGTQIRIFPQTRIFRNRTDNNTPNGQFDELVAWFGLLTAEDIQAINEYAVCFHELEPFAGVIFNEAPPGTWDYPTPYVKYQDDLGRVRYANTDTGQILNLAAGEVPLPGISECGDGGAEGSCCDEDAVYEHKVFDLINGATWTPADLPAGVELIEFSFSVIINAADNGVINFDATPAGDLPTGYSVDGRSLEGGVITPPQIIDSGTAGRILVDATWRLP